MRKGFVLILVSLLLAAATSPAGDKEEVSAQRQELERIKAELENKRNSIEKLREKEKGVVSELDQVEEELELVNRLLSKMGKQEGSLTRNISHRNLELLETELLLKQKRELLSWRLNQTYRYGRTYQAKVLLSAESPVDFLKKYYYLNKLTQKNRELVTQVLEKITQVEKTKKDLEQDLRELKTIKKDKKTEEENRQKVKTQKENLLRNVRQEKNLQEEAVAQLEESKKKLEKIIEDLEKVRKEALPELPSEVFAASKGALPWPVLGDILSNYGEMLDPKTKTVTFNPGIVIQSPLGEGVKAVADGILIYNSFLRGYGRFVILQHDSGYYTLYAHLSEVLFENGSLVRAGDIIGRVGDSGSLVGPALHFEIRQGKTQLDPMEWLK